MIRRPVPGQRSARYPAKEVNPMNAESMPRPVRPVLADQILDGNSHDVASHRERVIRDLYQLSTLNLR